MAFLIDITDGVLYCDGQPMSDGGSIRDLHRLCETFLVYRKFNSDVGQVGINFRILSGP